jgi:hypothetical protein
MAFALAHVAIGLAFGLPGLAAAAISTVLVVIAGDGGEGTALSVIVTLPAVLICVGAGAGLARLGVPEWLALPVIALALAPAVWAGVERARRGPHVSPAIEATLPTRRYLTDMCVDGETSRRPDPGLTSQARALLREVERRPQELISWTFFSAHSGDQDRREITIHQLAEIQADSLNDGFATCAPALARQLRHAVG